MSSIQPPSVTLHAVVLAREKRIAEEAQTVHELTGAEFRG